MSTTPSPEADNPQLGALFRELGHPTAEFKAATATIVVWLFLYALAFLLGTAGIVGGLIWAAAYGFNFPFGGGAKGRLDWLKLGVLVLGGVSLTLGGGFFFRLKWRDLSNRILVCPGGFINLGKKIADEEQHHLPRQAQGRRAVRLRRRVASASRAVRPPALRRGQGSRHPLGVLRPAVTACVQLPTRRRGNRSDTLLPDNSRR